MRIALVGCGYAADFYLANLPNHPQLELVGAYDRDPARLDTFSRLYGLKAYGGLDELLADRSVELVLNLTNPSSHFEISHACLSAGKHVYSEKPFALDLEQAHALLALAEARGVHLASAPCTLLGEPAQTMWKALREGAVGRPVLAIAELSEGMICRMRHQDWVSRSGAVWPAADEFATGCTLEHAAYVLTWLTAFFGRISAVTGRAFVVTPHDRSSNLAAPDFSTAVIEFEIGMVARVTFSIVAPCDRTLTIIGCDGVVAVDDVWRFGSPVWLRRGILPSPAKTHAYLGEAEIYPCVEGPLRTTGYADNHDIDQMRGVAEFDDAVTNGKESRLSASRALHVLEATLAIAEGETRRMQTAFRPVDPMPWAT
jgi:predicted dehydrogenase